MRADSEFKDVQELFISQKECFSHVSILAGEVVSLIEEISPVIESYTMIVCPDCKSVCCIDRHSRFDRSDVIFMSALGKIIPGSDSKPAETEPCRFLGRSGCIRKRSDRPYRCTWFFCKELLDTLMKKTSSGIYREFIGNLHKISERRMRMIEEFDTIRSTFRSRLS